MFKIYFYLTYPITLIFLALIGIYRLFIRYAIGKSCMFQPTCSKYAFDSIREFGWLFGSILAVKRLVKCRPNGESGIDLPKLNLLGNYKWKC